MIAVCLTARASYARIATVLDGLIRRDLPVTVYAAAGALLAEYGQVADALPEGCLVRRLPTVFAGSTLETGALSTASALEAYARAFAWDRPDLVLVVADRREVLGATMAARYQNLPILHLLGGERSGSVDDEVRDAITALSTYHAVPHLPAYRRVRTLKPQADVRVTGCPSVDLCLRSAVDPAVTVEELGGVGPTFPLTPQTFDVALLHPDLNHLDRAATDAARILLEPKLPQVVIWPGEDPGGAVIAKTYRMLRERHPQRPWHFVRHIPPRRFYRLLRQAQTLRGNSSVAAREARTIPTLTVDLIGHRQDDRAATEYGDGTAGDQIAAWVQELYAHSHSRPDGVGARAEQEFSAAHA